MIGMVLLGALGVAAVFVFFFTIYAVNGQAREQRQQPGLSGAETLIFGMDGAHAGHAHTDCSAHTSVDCGGHGGH